MDASKGMDLIRLTIGTIDRFIYWLISIVYDTIDSLANLSIFSGENISEISNRIYVFLGVIMLFKVTFSLITYLINPDTMNDKTQGTGNLIKNVIISLFLVIIVPYAFDFLYSAQSAILEDKLIPRLVLGTSSTEKTSREIQMDGNLCGDSTTITNGDGEYIALVTLRPFLQIYDNQINNVSAEEKNLYCTGTIKQKLSKKVLYADTGAFNMGEYIFDYSFFISTACGILVLLLSINFAFDIAVRSIKLGFLEIIAPIPIISYIDPKSGKDGIFKKWYKQVFSTWASLFLRLAILYLVIYMIPIIDQRMSEINSENPKIVMLFLVIGALMFAKQAIPLIENIFGIKIDKTVQLNPFKKISDQALFGKQVLGVGGAAAGAGIGAISYTGKAISDRLKNAPKNKMDLEKRRYDLAYKRLGQNPTDKNLDRAEKYEERYNAAKAKYEARKATDDIKKENKEDRREALETNGAFRFGKAVVSGVVQSKDAMVEGFKQGEQQKLHPIDIGTKSAKSRDYKEMYSTVDRIKDTMTDFLGIKNDSGTTSAVKKAIKDQEQILDRINRNIEIATKSFSDLQTKMGPVEFNSAITMNQDGTMSVKDNYQGVYREALITSVNQLNQLEKDKLAAQKELKEQQNIKDKKSGPPKP